MLHLPLLALRCISSLDSEFALRRFLAMSATPTKRNYGDVLVLGLGKTGEAAAQYFLSLCAQGRVSSVTVYGGLKADANSDAVRALERAGATVVCGTEEIAGSYSACVTSPGISEFSDFYQNAKAHSAYVMSEPELAYEESPENWVAITGTNGKTTTTTLVRDLLRAGGFKAEAVGNIGTLAIGEVASREPDEWLVCEMSSFQCAGIHDFHPKAAILLNVTPDHLYWHNTMENYAAAKEKLFANMGTGDVAIVSDGDAYCQDILARLDAREATDGLTACMLAHAGVADDVKNAAWQNQDGDLVVRIDGTDTILLNADELSIKGEHNVQNALAAAVAALSCGVSVEDVRTGLSSFKPLEHRIEPCGQLGGVSFVNDSKATNTDAVSKALTAFKPGTIVVLLGGHDKGTDLGEMCADVARLARVAVCFGEAGERIAQACKDAAAATGSSLEVVMAEHLEQALDAGIDIARAGETVLLSPACSSFDEFGGFEERGDVFKQLVAERIQASR